MYTTKPQKLTTCSELAPGGPGWQMARMAGGRTSNVLLAEQFERNHPVGWQSLYLEICFNGVNSVCACVCELVCACVCVSVCLCECVGGFTIDHMIHSRETHL